MFEQKDARPTQDDDEDGGVDIVLSQEVEVVLGLDLAPGAEADEDAAGDGEEEVDEHHEVLDHAVAAVLHPGAAGRLSEIDRKSGQWTDRRNLYCLVSMHATKVVDTPYGLLVTIYLISSL